MHINLMGNDFADPLYEICKKSKCETCVAVDGKPVIGDDGTDYMCMTGLNRGKKDGQPDREET